jgi:transcriptional regulator with XRE-family HTH domain
MISYSDLNIALKLKKLRDVKGISYAQMASKLNLSTRGYRNIEDGQTALSLPRLVEICNILDCTLEQFFDFDSKNIFNFNNQQGKQKLINQGVVNEKDLIDNLLKIKDDLLVAKDEIIASKNALIDQLQHKLNS